MWLLCAVKSYHMEQCLDVGPGDRPAGWSGIHGDAGRQHGR